MDFDVIVLSYFLSTQGIVPIKLLLSIPPAGCSYDVGLTTIPNKYPRVSLITRSKQ